MFDIGKKLIIKYAKKDSQIEEILVYFYKYLTVRNIHYIRSYIDMYNYYDLEVPNSNWVNYCHTKYTLI